MSPMVGAEGVDGCGFITTTVGGSEVPPVVVTVKLYDPAESSETMMLVSVPVPGIAPGLIVQAMVGKLVSSTLPVSKVHVGCVIATIVGGLGCP